MRIAHITDLHYSTENSTYEYRMLFRALIDSLKEEHKEKKIDLVFITGDLLDKAGRAFGQEDGYKILEEKILKEIYQCLGLGKGRVMVIPGNHDVKEGNKEQFRLLQGFRSNTEVKSINEIADDYCYPLDPFVEVKDKKIFPSLEAYKNFEKRFYHDFPGSNGVGRKQLTSLESYFVLDFKGAKIGIGAFNSAWSCHSELDRRTREGEDTAREKWKHITFGTRQIQRAADFFNEETDFNIALIHHPITPEFYGAAEEMEIAKELSRNKFFMLFCGHTHRINDRLISTPGYQHYLITTRSTFSDPEIKHEEYKSGFSLIDITYSSDTHINITRHYKKYFRHPGKFGFDQEESYDGKSNQELNTRDIGRRFVEYLKEEDPLYDPKRKLLFDTINGATQQYLKSQNFFVTDLALKKLIDKLLPATNRSFHIRQEFKLTITIEYMDGEYYSLKDNQGYTIVPNGNEPVLFHTYTYVDVDTNKTDKSQVEVRYLEIDGEDCTKGYVKVPNNSTDCDIPLCRDTYTFDKELEGGKNHTVKRELHAINSLKLNKAWKIEVVNIYYDYEITISNPDKKYLVEVFNIESGKNASNLDEDGTVNDKPIIIKEKEGVLTPGDTILIIVNLF
jgi:predicted phosphodiesterase